MTDDRTDLADSIASRCSQPSKRAVAIAPRWRAVDPVTRAGMLATVADRLDATSDELVALAIAETHLGEARLRGELARTTFQLRFLGEVIAEGSHLEACIDRPDATWPSGAGRTCAGCCGLRARGGLRRQQLPVRLQRRGRRLGFRARGRVPGAPQGAPGSPAVVRAVRRDRPRGLVGRFGARRHLCRHQRRRGRPHAGHAPGRDRRRLHRLGESRTDPVRPRRRTPGADPLLRRAREREPRFRDATSRGGAPRGDPLRLRRLVQPGIGAILHPARDPPASCGGDRSFAPSRPRRSPARRASCSTNASIGPTRRASRPWRATPTSRFSSRDQGRATAHGPPPCCARQRGRSPQTPGICWPSASGRSRSSPSTTTRCS